MFIIPIRNIKTKKNKCTTDENRYLLSGIDERNPAFFNEKLKTMEEICILNNKHRMKIYLESNVSIFLKLDFLELHTEYKPFNIRAGGLLDDWEINF